MPSTHIAALRALLEREKGVLLPGAPNALAARIIADLGFKATLRALRDTGVLDEASVTSFEERQRLVGKPAYDAMEARYATASVRRAGSP